MGTLFALVSSDHIFSLRTIIDKNVIHTYVFTYEMQHKCGNKRTDYFTYGRGVREGCVLSTLLYNLYLNEIPNLLQACNSNDPIIFQNGMPLKRCFDTVFQRRYQYFSIELKVFFSMSDRYKIFTSNWLWTEICENVLLSKIYITMTTINKKL